MRIVWLTGLAALALLAGLAWTLAPLEPGVVALQFAFTPRSFATIVHAWSPEQLAQYRAHLPIDFALLACYGSFGFLFVSRSPLFAHHAAKARAAVKWSLPIAAACDAAENALHLWLTEVPRFGIAWPYMLSATCSGLKWALLAAFGIVVAHALLRDNR